MLIQPAGNTAIYNLLAETSTGRKVTTKGSQSSVKDTFTPSPELQIKQILQEREIDFHNIQRSEVLELSETLFDKGLISPAEQLLMNTPTKWDIRESNGQVLDVKAGSANESLDYLNHWDNMKTVGSQEARRTASAIYNLFTRLQSAAT